MIATDRGTLWITPDLEVRKAEPVSDNGHTGDKRVALVIADRADGSGREAYLETNGGPTLIGEDEGTDRCSLDQAAEALGMDREELDALLADET